MKSGVQNELAKEGGGGAIWLLPLLTLCVLPPPAAAAVADAIMAGVVRAEQTLRPERSARVGQGPERGPREVGFQAAGRPITGSGYLDVNH